MFDFWTLCHQEIILHVSTQIGLIWRNGFHLTCIGKGVNQVYESSLICPGSNHRKNNGPTLGPNNSFVFCSVPLHILCVCFQPSLGRPIEARFLVPSPFLSSNSSPTSWPYLVVSSFYLYKQSLLTPSVVIYSLIKNELANAPADAPSDVIYSLLTLANA